MSTTPVRRWLRQPPSTSRPHHGSVASPISRPPPARARRRSVPPNGTRTLAAIGSESPFVDAWVPVLRSACRQLLLAVPAYRDWLSGESIRALERYLVRELSRLGELALLEDFRAQTGTPTAASSAGYKAYIRNLLATRYGELFGGLPVLTRQAVLLTDQWVEQIAALVSRLQDDRAAIESTFGAAAGQVRRLTPGLSDRHAGGCRVALVEFASGLRLAYKPREVRLERVFNEWLHWLRQSGLAVVPCPLRVIDRGTHGWVDWVEQGSLDSSPAVHAYFRSAGALVCLAHVLGGTDLHSENLIASAEGPVLVDTEMLLQPSTRPSTRPPADALADEELAAPSLDSCLASGLVSLMVVDRERDRRSTSAACSRRPRASWRCRCAAGSTCGATTSVSSPSIGSTRCCATTSGRTAMFSGPRTLSTTCVRASNRPIASSRRTARRCWLRTDRSTALQTPVPGSCSARATSTQRRSICSRRHATSGGDSIAAWRSRCSTGCLSARSSGRGLWPLVHDERRALETLDIPRVTLLASGTDLEATTGEVVRAFYARSGVEADARSPRFAVRRRSGVADRSTADRSWQRRCRRPCCRSGAEDDDLHAAAERVGVALLGRARPGPDGSLRWPSSRGRGDLYSGASGIGLFLAALAAATGHETWA